MVKSISLQKRDTCFPLSEAQLHLTNASRIQCHLLDAAHVQFPSLSFSPLLSLLFPKPSDILCYIWGASVDQSPPRIKQRAACNPYGYKQGLSLTETRFCAAFSAAYQTWFKGSFWFHKETLFCPSPNSSQAGGGEKKASVALKEKEEQLSWNFGERFNIPMLYILFVVSSRR